MNLNEIPSLLNDLFSYKIAMRPTLIKTGTQILEMWHLKMPKVIELTIEIEIQKVSEHYYWLFMVNIEFN